MLLCWRTVRFREWKPVHSGPRFTKNLRSDRNRKHISGAKMRFTKIIILWLRVFSNITKLCEWLNVVVTIVCWLTMALVVFFQEDGDVLSVYRNLKISCETALGVANAVRVVCRSGTRPAHPRMLPPRFFFRKKRLSTHPWPYFKWSSSPSPELKS